MKDGGYAFPSVDHMGDGPQGMTLRDWFAGQALAGLMAHPDNEFAFGWTNSTTGERRLLGYGCKPGGGDWKVTRTPDQGMALNCYTKADAMLVAREGGSQ